MVRKLNLGAGRNPIDGYTNMDRKTGQEVYPLGYPAETVDEIRASHVLEHFPFREVPDVFADWLRTLKPGGVIKIAVPDLDVICNLYRSGQLVNPEPYIMGGQTDDDDFHGAAFTQARLCKLFYDAGLEDVREWEDDAGDCASLPISLNLQGRKPISGEIKFEGVYGVLPSARYGPAMHHKCIYEALQQLNLSIHSTGGCFWNQHLCPAMEECAKRPDCKYVLTFDYDSVFTAEDVRRLYRIMETHPQIDALSPVQSHRGTDTPLFTMGKASMPAELLHAVSFPVETTHFGLTLIRAEKLLQLPHPWMMGQPDDTGRWGRNRIDPDIWFWRQWEKAGFSVHITPQVSIGHIDELILWAHKKDLTPIHQRTSDYIEFGKPMEAL